MQLNRTEMLYNAFKHHNKNNFCSFLNVSEPKLSKNTLT